MPKVEISLVDILKYVEGRERPLKEGEALFKAGHIILCGVDNSGKIRSLCLQTSALSQPPHEIEILLSEPQWMCKCTCKAGNSGFCKHVVGTLIYINRNEDLDIVSCTDVTQAWGKEKKAISEMYGQTEVSQFCHQPRTGRTSIREDRITSERNLHRLINRLQSSSLGKFMDRDASVEETSRNRQIPSGASEDKDWKTNLIKHLELSQILPVGHFDSVITTLEPCCQKILRNLGSSERVQVVAQGSEEWSKERQLRLTGSRCYGVFTYSKIDEWEGKSLRYFWPQSFSNIFTRHGLDHEKEALQCYIDLTDSVVKTPQFIVSKEFPWLGYSPDGVVFKDNQPTLLLEIKCPFEGTFQSAEAIIRNRNFIEVLDGKFQIKKKHQYYGQVQMGMALLNLTTTHFIVYSSFSKSIVTIEVKLDKEFCRNLLETASFKFLKHMLHFYCKNKIIMEPSTDSQD